MPYADPTPPSPTPVTPTWPWTNSIDEESQQTRVSGSPTALQLPDDSGQELVAYSSEPGSQTEGSLVELAPWAPARDRAALEAVEHR